MAAALRKAGLMERLKAEGQQLTFFAPNDAAFEALDEATRAKVINLILLINPRAKRGGWR